MIRSLRILIVEDNEDDTLLLVRELVRSGYDPTFERVDTRESMSAALIQSKWDVIIADYALPKFSAPEALALLKELGIDIPFIIVSGTIDEETAVASLKAGAHDFMLKSRLKRLAPAIERELREVEVRQARKRAEEAMLHSETQLRAVLETVGEGIITIDSAGMIVMVNQEVQRIWGHRQEELIGKNIQSLMPEKYRQAHAAGLMRYLETGVSQVLGKRLEMEGLKKDGSTFPLEILIAETKVGPGLFFTAAVSDISERKLGEEKLIRYARELERSNNELQQFAYICSHDLQEPLRTVASYVQLLAKRYKGKLDGDADEFIGYAVDGAIRMQGLIEGLLAYSRVGTQGKPFELTPCDTVLNEVLENLIVSIKESGGLVTRDPLPSVMADKLQLVQLFQNLIGNAIKFRKVEPLRVHVSARPIETKDDTNNDEEEPVGAGAHRTLPGSVIASGDRIYKEWLFSVHDNGIGIDPKYGDRIFMIFQRLHTQTEYPGTGIGLSICKKIVERHGGRIWMQSEPGKGAIFYFTIPMRRKPKSDDMFCDTSFVKMGV